MAYFGSKKTLLIGLKGDKGDRGESNCDFSPSNAFTLIPTTDAFYLGENDAGTYQIVRKSTSTNGTVMESGIIYWDGNVAGAVQLIQSLRVNFYSQSGSAAVSNISIITTKDTSLNKMRVQVWEQYGVLTNLSTRYQPFYIRKIDTAGTGTSAGTGTIVSGGNGGGENVYT